MRSGFAVLNHAAPALAARWAERIFFTPPRRVVPREELLANARRSAVSAHGDRIAAWSWGEGPAVALVHGWGGWGGQLAAFVPPLLARGFSVVTFDAPGHGFSGGTRSSLPQFALALSAVSDAFGPFSGLVAHSLGAAATALALDQGLRAHRAVFIGPPTDPSEWTARFTAAVGVGPRVIGTMQARFERRWGVRWSDLSVPAVGRRISVPLLVVHDREDAEVPFSHGAAIAASWTGAQILETTGLGHRRILRDSQIIDRVVEFMAAGRPARDVDGTLCATEGCDRRPEANGALCDRCSLEDELFDRDARWQKIFARA